jgi:hypothetical protein
LTPAEKIERVRIRRGCDDQVGFSLIVVSHTYGWLNVMNPHAGRVPANVQATDEPPADGYENQ